jgi:hypothetical protein
MTGKYALQGDKVDQINLISGKGEQVKSRSHRKPLTVAAVLAAALSLGGAGAAGASGASVPVPTPVSLTDCKGSLAHDASGASIGEPNLTDYRFSCDGSITSYTIVVNRRAGDTGNLDDFNPSPNIFETDGVTPSPTVTALCSGTTPSNGINCNFGAGGALTTGFVAVGAVDLVAPYCKSLPARARPGTLAIPRAIAQVIVTDATGAQDGPFELSPSWRCPRVAGAVPAQHKRGAKHGRK